MNVRKKIAFVIESLDCGGAEKSLVTLLQNLDYSRFQVSLLLLKAGGPFEKLLPEDVRVQYLPFQAGTIGNRISFLLSRKFGNKKLHTAQKFWKVFRQHIPMWPEHYDLAISYSQGFCTYFVAEKMEAARKYTWLNTDYVKAGYDAAFDWPYYHKYNTVVAVSEEGAEVFKAAMHTAKPDNEPDIITIKDISDRNVIVAQSKIPVPEVFDRQSICIVTVCRLEPPKGLHLAVEACKILVDQGYTVQWYVVGEGSERNRLEQLIRDNDLADNFHLLGFRDNPYPYIAQADIYVQTSLYEGWGLTLIEATLLQKPVVTTNFPTAYQIIDDKVNGYITDMEPNALAEKIAYLINHENLRIAMSQQLNPLSELNKTKSLDQINTLLQ